MSTKEFSFERLYFSVDARCDILTDILKPNGATEEETLNADGIRQRWADHLESVLPPCPWTAFWKPSRASKTTPNNSSVSNESEINHFVDVIKINYDDLTATVEVLDVNGIKRQLPLVELHGPLRISEDDDQFDFLAAKGALDHLYFFMSYLWYPWDDDDDDDEDGDDGSDWVEQHLRNRLEVYRSFVDNSGDGEIFLRIGRLAREYSEVVETIKQIRENESGDAEMPEEDLITLHQQEKRLEDIKIEADILENPSLRTAFELTRISKKRSEHSPGKLNCLVWPGGDFYEMSHFINKVGEMSSFDATVNTIVSSSLQEAINRCLPGDQIYLPAGVHSLVDLADFKDGAAIFGLNLVDTIIEIDCRNLVDSFGMSIGGSGATFENLSISALNAHESGIILRNGTTFLSKVHISGFKIGVKILQGGALVARRCEIFDCNRALEISSGGCLQATDVDISHSKVGIVIKDKSGDNIKLERVNVRCDQDILVVEEGHSSCDTSSDDILSKTLVTNSSLGESKLVPYLKD